MSDIKYFKGLDKSSQDNIIKELKEVHMFAFNEREVNALKRAMDRINDE